ncbi:hypothetical protein N9L20_06165 [Flavobacteriaceae bacterium]|nr:hypothetical protein [Flavobacteriaceae bacterium]
MVKDEFLKAINQSFSVGNEHRETLKVISRKYPYFQAAKAIYLKSLKDSSQLNYNQELKYTAAQTIDRTVLFDYITSEEFRANSAHDSEPQIEEPVEEPSVESVIDFTPEDSYSFSEWLKLSSLKPLADQSPEEKPKVHMDLVDKFLSSNPKMPKPEKSSANNPVIKQKESPETELMTETLAQVYLAQKKYDNAIIAYRILSLKNPEKSTFFADQIAKIELLKKNKS